MSIFDYVKNYCTVLHCKCRCFSFKQNVQEWRKSRKLVLFIVFVALLLDNMLMTVIVPIIPDYIITMDTKPTHLPSPVNENCTVFNNIPTPPFAICYNDTSSWNSTTGNVSLPGKEPLSAGTDALKKKYKNREESVKIGLLFASKAFCQLLANPVVGPVTNRYGYSVPMFTGFVIMFASTVVFAFGTTYPVLLVARSIQGVGSSCSSVAGMGMLAHRYSGDEERGAAMGIALAGLAFGVLIGPPFGGVMYDFIGKESPFYALALLALADGLLQLFVLSPGISNEAQAEGTPILTLLRDPYILIAAGAITFGNMGIALLEPSLPIWMLDNMTASKWQLGIIFLPASVSYLISTNIFGPYGLTLGRWLCSMIGIVLAGVAMLTIPLAKSVPELIGPNLVLGLAVVTVEMQSFNNSSRRKWPSSLFLDLRLQNHTDTDCGMKETYGFSKMYMYWLGLPISGMVDATMMPIMGYLVDVRHVSVYGSVYAIADIAFCVGFAVGPSFSGEIVQLVGFTWFLRIVALLGFFYAPLCYFLKDPPIREDRMAILLEERLPVSYSEHRVQQGVTSYNTIQDDGYHTMADDSELPVTGE